MYLMYYLNEKGERIYTLKVTTTCELIKVHCKFLSLILILLFLFTETNTRQLPDRNSSSCSILAGGQIFSSPTHHQEALQDLDNAVEESCLLSGTFFSKPLQWHRAMLRSRSLYLLINNYE